MSSCTRAAREPPLSDTLPYSAHTCLKDTLEDQQECVLQHEHASQDGKGGTP